MEYTTTITVDVPRAKFVDLMDNPDNMKHWQKGFISMEHLDGDPGKTGAKSQLNYKMGNREMEMTETITKANWPHEFHATYDTKSVINWQENFFQETGDGKTEWICKSKFKCSGFMRIVALLMGGAFKKQTRIYMEAFKAFAEEGTSVAKE